MPIVELPNGQRLEFPDGMSQQEMSSAIQKNFPEFSQNQGAEQAQSPKDMFMQKFNEQMDRSGGLQPESALGWLAGTANLASSAKNALYKPINKLAGTNLKSDYFDFKEMGRGTPGANAAYEVGQFFTPLGVLGKLQSALKAAAAAKGAGKVGQRAAQATGLGAAGAVLGGSEDEALSRGVAGTASAASPLAVPAAKAVAKPIKKAVDWFKKPQREMQLHKDVQSELGRNQLDQKRSVRQAKEGAAKVLNDESGNLEPQMERSRKRIYESLPDVDQVTINKNKVDFTKKQSDEIKGEFNRRYGDFDKAHGKNAIENPVDKKVMTQLSSMLKGRAVKGIKPAPTIKVKNNVEGYISAMRTARDAGLEHLAQAKHGNNLTHTERQALRKKGKKLMSLSNKFKKSMLKSVDKDGRKNFKNIQNDYSEIAVPLKTSNVFSTAIDKGRVTGDFLGEINQPINERLRERFAKSPEFKDLVLQDKLRGTAHPLAPESGMSEAQNINKLLKTNNDVAQYLSPEQRKMLTEHAQAGEHMADIKKLKSKVNSSEMNRLINDADLSKLKNYSEDVERALNKIQLEQRTERQLAELAKRHNLNKEELQKAVDARKKIKLYLGAAATVETLHKGYDYVR